MVLYNTDLSEGSRNGVLHLGHAYRRPLKVLGAFPGKKKKGSGQGFVQHVQSTTKKRVRGGIRST